MVPESGLSPELLPLHDIEPNQDQELDAEYAMEYQRQEYDQLERGKDTHLVNRIKVCPLSVGDQHQRI